ncbi:MAG: sugar phosphate nucleotidyltransferase [Polyangiaceae bacterium]
MRGTENRDLWSIVLAAGDGTRLRSLTRALHGEDLPKQFARIEASRSLLQSTVERALGWSVPERIVVVVASEREELARRQLLGYGAVTLVSQPKNLGTGPGILLPLAHVMAADPEAKVVILPSDHFVREEAPFRDTIRRARSRAEASDSLVLIGAEPDFPDPQYGWIVPRKDKGITYVDCFEEKPSESAAQRLLDKGALWNTFVLVASARHLWSLGSTHLPEQSQALEICVREHNVQEPDLLAEIYASMPAGDFSRDVLEHASGLEMVSLPECGWSDWGTPERVLASLRGTSEFARLSERLRSKHERLAWKATAS